MESAQSEQTTMGLQSPERALQGGTSVGRANLKGTFDGSLESFALESSTDYR
jgi:hypothetical protein